MYYHSVLVHQVTIVGVQLSWMALYLNGTNPGRAIHIKMVLQTIIPGYWAIWQMSVRLVSNRWFKYIFIGLRTDFEGRFIAERYSSQ
ncbi:hypothetical protein CEXT_759761 [Caerostris extrusa]|uniref:Uncharacterized protein n=1 Tax=Caerostris extrusa TaxID=172846 RepID=A0AAV4MQX7_CAEEX|nr:hypothetical protein CEXT_759761 [Caerostris extrusa]